MILFNLHKGHFLGSISDEYYEKLSSVETPEYYSLIEYTSTSQMDIKFPCNEKFEQVKINELTDIEKLFYKLHIKIYMIYLNHNLNTAIPWWIQPDQELFNSIRQLESSIYEKIK